MGSAQRNAENTENASLMSAWLDNRDAQENDVAVLHSSCGSCCIARRCCGCVVRFDEATSRDLETPCDQKI